ncbi:MULTISPECIES: glycosyltransferase family 2 protein [unclassified Pseudoalteromonas]|uniref:glycosyltransferase family 2 protein n=1 Tax=unclassified Pseudoalteromonas TaxID=194690 RepID=UPI000491F4C5|nr:MULTISPECIES: glycosyltransferase family 2 protein [unclassified Pseudoalteromonas]
MNCKNLTIIVLTFNEELHIKRCLESFLSLNARIIVVDSFSNDKTCHIAKSFGAEVFKNPFINQAQQFQWAIDNCNISSDWVLRLDADETVDNVLVENINSFILKNGNGHNGAIFNRKHIFLGKWVKYGGRYPLPMLRLFRRGTAHIEQRWMDEHIVLDEGSSCLLKGGFADDNLNSVSWFIDKHNKYASREVVDIMLKRLLPNSDSKINAATSLSIKLKRFFKQSVYMRLPYFVRPFVYFNFRYFLQLGFLDGSRGFAYHFMQAFWYRTLVDLKCIEIEKEWNNTNTNNEKLAILERLTGYSLDKYK